MADSSGFCIAASGSTGGAATTAGTLAGQTSGGPGGFTTNTSGNTSGTGGTTGFVCMGTGLFCGGWFPADAGYEPALTGDGGTTVVVDATAPTNAPTLFGGSNTGPAPTLVYPPDGVLIPPNMNSLDIQFVPGSGQTVFAITFQGPGASMVAYTACQPVGGGCHYLMSASSPFWDSVVDFARGTTPITWTVTGVDGSAPGAVGTSASQSIAIADQDINGGIYYWNDNGNIQRYDWGLPNSPAETWLQPALGETCISCHVMDRVGDLAVADYSAPLPSAPYYVYAVSTASPIQVSGKKEGGTDNFFSFSPDGTLLLGSNGSKITMRDVNTASAPTVVIPSGTMPDWSPSGTTMVFAKPGSSILGGLGGPTVMSASLQVSTYNGTSWSSPTTLVPFAGANNYYPAFSPTGDWIVFNQSPSNIDSFSNAPGPLSDAGYVPDGELWAVPSAGGSPIKLAQATDPGATSWPKWAPVVNDYYGGHIMWLTFTSARAYGLEMSEYQQAQLWMVAFDPAKAAAGQDPSFPAFYLPFQSNQSGNHIAQWVTKVVRHGCTENSQCEAGDECTNNQCVPIPLTHDPVGRRQLRRWMQQELRDPSASGRISNALHLPTP